MGPVARHRILTVAAFILAAAGAIDAAVGEVWDLFAVLALIGALVLVDRWLAPDVPIRVRPDLQRWLSDRAALEGEPIDAIATRAIATYREHLTPPEHPRGGERDGG